MFKRRSPRNFRQSLVNLFIPGGGWGRSANYVMHRLRRLPDSPERIAKGIAAGVGVSCLPLFGLHFVAAASIAWALRGNILASLLATFFGNPFTFPLIVVSSMELGSFLLGRERSIKASEAMNAFGAIWGEFGRNFLAIFSSDPIVWEKLGKFGDDVFVPYMLGGSFIGLVCGVIAYFLSLPLIRAYRNRRLKKLQERFEQARKSDAKK
ncbi:DUF2062 domain-containing protein [Roseinatronobacter bogoriensis]|uniref:DUF2062 domain-containing protein n=1 Tax=Roseinatronobacter bogoriensis TaxID=119542 RepID=UPI0023ED7FA3|nr:MULTISPECIES: DUF2062 domain-containing protein [Rhodobaca]